MTLKYLNTSELIAVDHLAKVVTAYTLTTEDLPERAAKRLRDHARAVRMYVEVREYAEAVSVAESLRQALSGDRPAMRVLDRCIATLRRSAG